ncbi:50S ribosomal protein L25/general stress protein Ctc [Motiliproteus sp. MSK22-1]|uniref:50S ribosomal protein L25/general stress protein Ctc n=1 Tax=Motiliproteus sp. MSK22-1 TaxID=1897630 RepID=UPI000975F931|nr:50S ribosomal protein L25/general stress protein Ctc [Motiliproteus sp. MSK22-1]OMH39029.1 50S ribosomal protein L25/general stress protein Ctc [Motiliproteus sp. MSK22-1]
MSNFVVNAVARADMGKGASRRLRREEGNIPAILFGGDKDPQPLTLVHKDLFKQLENEAFFSSILTINVDGTEEKAILKDLQRHPAKNIVLHADFLRVKEGVQIKITVPLHFTNEDKSSALKLGGKVSHTMNQVAIVCNPENLPPFLEVDMQNVKVDEIVHLSDIILPEGVEIAALRLGADHDQAVANITGKRGS